MKSKIAPASSPAEGTEKNTGRRSFLNLIWTGLGLAALAEAVWLTASFFNPRRNEQNGPSAEVIRAGKIDDFALDSVTAFPRGHFYLFRLKNGGFLALSRQCTHLGCTVPWNEKEKAFICPCHASAFDIRGDVIHSPALRALDIYGVTIENDVVLVDTGRRTRRSGFEPKQVVYPKKK